MSKRFLQLSFYAVFWLFCLCAFSTGIEKKKTEAWDRSKVEYRHPSAVKMEAYRQESRYIYDRLQKPDSWWDQVKRWIWSKFTDSGFNPKILVYLFMGIAVCVFLFVVLMLLGIRPSGLFIFKRNERLTHLNFKQGVEDIYGEDLDQMLNSCIRHGAYREAIRLLYLLSIRQLDQLSWIEWKPWKTNRDYYYELKGARHKEEFKRLVLNYEYIWYGQFHIDQSKFEMIKDEFDSFKSVVGADMQIKGGDEGKK
jgi:hypothetical protein